MWPFVFYRILICLWMFQFFTSSVLAMKKAYWEAAILWVTVPIVLTRFYRICNNRMEAGTVHIPLEMAQMAPAAQVDPNVYLPPSLVPGCAGWHPEYMKAWVGWGAPAYTF